jgi:hypothetical protein
MGIVNIQGIGGVEFPDDMSPQDIQKAIETEILPKFPDVAAKGKRSFGEAATDVGGSFISGVGNLLQLPGQVGQLAGITDAEEKPTGLQGVGKTVEEFGQGLKSPVLKAREQVRSQKIAAAEGEGGALDVAKQAGVAFLETIKDPALLTSFFAEQIPNLIGTMGGGLLARGGVKLLMKEATESAVGKAGVAGAVGTGVVMQGADVGSDTYEQVFKRLVAEGTDSEEANRIALAQGRQAALQAAGISLGTAFLPGGRSIERALAGKGAPGVGGFTRGFIGETGSEALEEGGGQFVSNVAQQEIFPDVSLTRGVGEAAGMGALGGGLFGGVAGGINARSTARIEEQQRLTADAEEGVRIAEEQERIAANDAANAEIKRRAFAEQGGITTSKAFEELSAEVEAAKEKAAKAVERANKARDKVDAEKAKFSAFTEAQPDLFGDVVSDQTQQTQQEEAQSLFQQPLPGQLELGLTDQEGQLGLPGIGMAQPSPTIEQPAPVESLVINKTLTKALGIPGGARNVLNAVEGKDLTDPQQRSEVRDVLTAFANRTNKQGTAAKIEQFLNSSFFAEEQGLPLTDAQGQLGLPGVGMAQPRQVLEQGVETPINTPIISAQSVTNLGFPKNAEIRTQLEGKDLTDPKQRAEVRDVLSKELTSENVKPQSKIAKNIRTALANSPFLQVQTEMLGPRGGVLSPVQRGRQIPVTETPPTQETQDVSTGQPTGGVPPTEPTVDGRAGKQGVGVAGVGTGSTTQQTGAAPRVQETGSGRLVDTTGGTQRDVRATAAAPAPVALTPKQKDQLNYLAGDIVFKVAGAKAKYNKLSPEEKAYIDGQIKEYKNRPAEVIRVERGTSTPTLVDAANRGSLARALNEIANNEKFSPLERVIARRLMENTMYSLPKIQVVPKEQLGEADGQYDPQTDTISIAEGAVDSHTVLHEAVHGYVHALIFKFENGEVTNRALADLQRLYNSLLSSNPELAEQYGMASLTEFASEAMSNAQFQEALARIPYQNSNVFSKFAKMIMDLLGLGNTNTALAEAVISVERAMNVGRGVQEQVSGTQAGIAPANVVRKAELESLYQTANKGKDPKTNPNPVGSALNENAKAGERDAVRSLTTKLDAFETGALSFDAGLNNAIRRELNKDKRDWNTIKNMMMRISTAQALHSEALAMQFLEKGSLKYDPTSYKFFAEDKPDSWKSMMALMSDVAKRNGLTDVELRNYANTAFIAERVEGLAKSKPEFYSHMSKEQVAAGRQLFDKIDGLRDVQKMWNGVRANAMDVAVDNGLYSREQANDLLKYMDFVPFYREEQLETGAGPRKYPNGFIDFAKNFKIKGSDQPVADVFGNMALWTTYTVSRSVRNRTALNMYDTAKEVMPDQVEDIRQDASIKRSDNVVSFWENGQRKRVKFADPLFVKAFEGMESVAIPMLKDVAKATNFLRQTIVLNPLFSISQLSQDSFAAMMSSGLKNPLMIPSEVVRQFFNILMGANTTGKYLARAGMVGVNDYSSAVENNNLAVATGLKPKSALQKLLTPLEKFSMASDNAVRQALYNRTLLETGGKRQKDGSVVGGDEAAALERGFEIINFKRSGSNGVVAVGKQLVPFFGAYLQAMNVTAKVLAGRGITPSERAAAYKTLMANTMMVATLSMLYAALNGGDDDYEKMDPQVRDKHLVIPGTGFMLPLRSDFTLFPKLAAEYAYMAMTDNGFTDGKKVRRAMTEALGNAVLSPTAVPQFIKPAFEVGINHNFFTGRDLVGKGIAGLDKEMQYTASTSELGKSLGKLGILAPVQIDHLIKGYAGSLGGLLLLGTNSVMANSDVPKPEKTSQDALRQIPGLGTFFASEYGNAMKNDFYELRADVAKAVQTLNRLKSESPEKAREYLESNKTRIQLQGQVNAINNQLSKIRAYENQIRALPESRMNAEEKKVQIDRLRAAEERMLQNVYKLRGMAGY